MKDLSKIENSFKGALGEDKAVLYLKKSHYKILERNFKNNFGEIDIIASKDKVVVFVEVKSRETLLYGRPVEAVDFRKQSKIKMVADFYLMMHKCSLVDVRFDVIEIVGDEINHIENAFD